jgi:hypothetical protein
MSIGLTNNKIIKLIRNKLLRVYNRHSGYELYKTGDDEKETSLDGKQNRESGRMKVVREPGGL